MEVLALLLSVFLALTRAQDIEDAITTVLKDDNFLSNYEEVTPPPLRSIGALPKCGEGEQRNKFVCVPYYNCDSVTNTVQTSTILDGTNRIDIRGGTENKCAHYLDVCCQVESGTLRSNENATIPIGSSTTQRSETLISSSGTRRTTPTTRRTTSTSSTTPRRTSTDTNTAPTSSIAPPTMSFCGIRNPQGVDFTLNGTDREAEFGEFPWMVAILRRNQGNNQKLAICGGSLITPRVVLTGAHCVKGLTPESMKIRAGEWDTQTTNERIPFQERNVQEVVLHEQFTSGNLYNDVALLILDRSLTKTETIGTVCLPQQNQKFDSRNCFATGWGKETFGEAGRYSVILKKIQLPLVQNGLCQTALRKTRLGTSFLLHRTFICAGGEEGRDTCTGDGGSPLVCPDPNNPNRYYQTGIVAWGIGCGENGIPGVYADVAQFRNWVDERLEERGIVWTAYTL